MKNLILTLIALSFLILSKPSTAVAQVLHPLHARFHLTATVQEVSSDEPAHKFRERIVKIDNAKLLELLGAATTNDFSGAELLADSAGFGGVGFSVIKAPMCSLIFPPCFRGLRREHPVSWCEAAKAVTN